MPQPPRDWFLAAIECEGSVSDSLLAVLTELGHKAAFIAAVKARLEFQAPAGTDAATDLGVKVRTLENTLRFRLGILRPERPQAWFRAPAATTTGPFASSLIEEPVFSSYDAADAEPVRLGLEQAWAEAREHALPFKDSSPCLWRTLLGLNARLERLCCLPDPFAALRLDTLPDDLPAELESRALRAFLLNVRGELQATRERLTGCYKQLLETSEKLWAVQALQAELEKKARAEAPPRQPHAFGASRARPSNTAADDIREEFKRRRSSARAFLTPVDMEALRFMGFDDLPSADALRQRYLAMAKKLHPDRQGGSDHGFKTLTTAYSHLIARVEGLARGG